MSEQNIVNVMVIPDVPKVLPGEQLYVYVPKASFTSPGIIAYNDTQFEINGDFLSIRDDFIFPEVERRLAELKQCTDDKLQLKQDKEDDNISLSQRPEQKSVVGAINDLGTLTQEAKNAADQAQATANGSITTANEAKSSAQTAENNANSAVDKANNAIDRANKAYEKAANNVYAVGFMTLKEAITAVNGYDNTVLKTNDNILVVAQGSPDLYVTSVEATNIPYNFTTVDKFNDELVKNTVLQVGYYKVAFYETDGQPVTVAYQNIVVKSTDWVASTEFADFPYEAKIELTDFVDYKTVPQVVFDIDDTMSGNYAPICKSGDKCVYIYSKVQNDVTLKTVITFAPNVNGASVTGGGYNNRGKWVASTSYAVNDLVYTDKYMCIEDITSTTSPEQDTTHWQATFVATAPEALPQKASPLKSGSLPITGWKNLSAPVWTGAQGNSYGEKKLFNLGVTWESQDAMPTTGWTFSYYQDNPTSIFTNTKTWSRSDGGITTYIGDYFNLKIMPNGNVYFWTTSYNLNANWHTLTEITQTTLSKQGYTISDTSITANSDVLMELTDEGGVKPYSMEVGKITVIRDTVPTNPIPYTYKVKQTNASGQFTVLNHFVSNIPVTSVNGQTGAVTIAVPTKTSQLTNDSDYVSNLPTVQNVVCNDVESATTLDTTITCEVGDLILAQIIVRSALTLPTDWTLLRTIPAVETTYNQTLSFAYKRATSTSETLTVTQATSGRIYTNIVRLSDAASVSYIQSCEKTNTDTASISSTKPVTPNMVVWGVSCNLWNSSSPNGDWTYSPSTLDYYSLPQSTKQPRLGTFIDSSGAGGRTFTASMSNGSGNGIMCGAVEIVGDKVARKGDISTSLPQLTGTSVYDPFGTSTGENGVWKPNGTVIASSVTLGWGAGTHNLGTYSGDKTKLTEIVVKRDRLSNHLNVIVPRTSVADGVYTYTKTDEDNTTFTITINANNEITYKVTGARAYTTYWLQENNTTWYSTKKTLVYTASSEVWNADAIVEVNDGGGLKLFYKNELDLYFSRPSVPSSPIRCTYKVRQTSDQGQIVIINQYDGIGNIDGEWSEYIYPNVTLTEAGLYEIYAQSHDAFVYWDGKKLTKKLLRVNYLKSNDTEQTDVQRIYLVVDTIQITSEGVLSIEEFNTKYSLEGALITSGSSFSGFKYRKIK